MKAGSDGYVDLWLACTGCEEVKYYGAADFFRRYRDGLHNPAALVSEMLGCAEPAWLTREGVIRQNRSPGDGAGLRFCLGLYPGPGCAGLD